MAIRDDTRIGKLPPIAPNEPMPDTAPPDNCEWMRNAATGRWCLFRKMADEERIHLGRQPLPPEQEPDLAIRRVIEEEGARPSSLTHIQRAAVCDPLHDLQLLRDLMIMDERTVRELGPLPPGGVPVQENRKPEQANSGTALFDAVRAEGKTNHPNEDDAMKLSHLTAIAALTAGTMTCQPATSSTGGANTEGAQSSAPATASHSPATKATPRLGPEYKKIESFVEFRKKLLADGWKPVVNPRCREEVIEGVYCDLTPELVNYMGTFPGYMVTRYIKEETLLNVLSEGDITDISDPGKHGLYIDNWTYDNEK